MNPDERQFLLTSAWMFMRHGQSSRALAVCEALMDENPRDGVVAVALSGLLLDEGESARALELLRAAEVPSSLAHAAAVLETRALRTLGRDAEAADRWSRYIESRKGAARQWTA